MARSGANSGKTMVAFAMLSPALLVMLATLAAPLLALVAMSFWSQTGFDMDRSFTLQNYWSLIEPGEGTVWLGIPVPLAYPVPAILLVKSLAMALLATAVVIALAFPMAYFLAFRVTRYKAMWLILLTVPFWTSYLLRVFSWKIMLGFNGAINSALIASGLIDKPLDFLLYNPFAVVVTLAHSWIAFAVLPIYVSLEKIDRSLLEAASDLGDSRWRRFRRVTLPLSMPGTIAATLLVFIPTVGDYVTPTLVGGPGGTMIGSLVQQLFTRQDNAPLGAAISIMTMAIIGGLVWLFLRAIRYAKIRERIAG